MDPYYLFEIPAWVLALGVFTVLLVAIEIGIHTGIRRFRRSHKRDKEAELARGDVTLGAMFALLGLMLAFTYAVELNRHEMRKQAVVSEANAIGTAFLKADLANEPGRSELREQLLAYAKTRLVEPGTVVSEDGIEQAIASSRKIQEKLLPSTKKAIQEDIPAPVAIAIFSAINEVLDADARRIRAIYDHIPLIVFGLLLVIAALSLGVSAHDAGLQEQPNRWRMFTFAVILTASVMVIVDFERPLRGFVQVNQRPMIDLIASMEGELRNQSK